MGIALIPLAAAPLVYKLCVFPELRHLGWVYAGCFFAPVLAGAVHQMMTWNTVYSYTVDDEGVIYGVNDRLVSFIRWQDITKVNDCDRYYVKLFSATSRPIRIGYTLSIYGMTRRYITEKVPDERVRFMRFWTRPMKFSLWKTAMVVAGFYVVLGVLVAIMSYWETLKFHP